jgi:hypothetical protein
MPSQTVHFVGHIIDSLTLSKVLDLILRDGGHYEITHIDIGKTRQDTSHAELTVSAPDAAQLERILQSIQKHGVTMAK